MARAQVLLNYRAIGDMMRSATVRTGLRDHAQPIAGRVRQLAAVSGKRSIADSVRVENGTRPKGRPYSRVIVDDADAEFGTSKTTRWRFVGAAVDAATTRKVRR